MERELQAISNLLMWHWELNSGLLQEHQAVLIAEPHFRPLERIEKTKGKQKTLCMHVCMLTEGHQNMPSTASMGSGLAIRDLFSFSHYVQISISLPRKEKTQFQHI